MALKAGERSMGYADMVRTSNEWMRRYSEDPEKFGREFQIVAQFLAEMAAGKEPDYGALCTAYQFSLLEELKDGE